ncbi:MAG: helix-turn-helix domain-containing protein [Gammaproteobacteria bacterium]|nr:helix-turn-helix domain-containing protein [Gammaproteobacteria bacterium]
MAYGEWRPYVSVAQRRAMANREMKKLRKQSRDIAPVEIQGRKIASTFWGESWCTHLEGFSDFANRLPRGRTYVRNGSVCHLAIKQGKVEAIVSGSELYNVVIDIAPLPSAHWEKVRRQCSGQIGSMLELLQGRLSSRVMSIVTDPGTGLFPQPKDIDFHCDCPDWAYMCKHVAAVLYGVGARLDEKPELLFVLRKVDHEELISIDIDLQVATTGAGKRRRLANQDLSNIFGIDIEDSKGPATAHRPDKENSARKTTAQGAKDFTPTGVAISRLRKRFGMTRTQFADLIGVTPQTIASWENRRGKLKLQQRTRVALTDAWHSSTI